MTLILIDNDAGKTIRLAPNETTEVFCDGEGIPVINGLAKTSHKKFRVQFLNSSGDATGHDLGVRIVDCDAEGTVFKVFERHEIPRDWLAKGFLDLRGIDPLVAMKDTRAGFDDKAGHGGRKGQGRDEIKTWRAFSLDHRADGL